MTWKFSTNNTPSTGSVATFLIMTEMIAAGWVVKSSSDGTTYNSSGNQITSGGSGANGLANTDAWFRIQDPGALREYVFQRGTSNTQWRITYSKLAKFVTGSPSATQVPSASDSVLLVGGGTDSSPTFGTFFGTDGGYRFSCAAQSTATSVQPGGSGGAINCYPFFSLGWTIGAGSGSQTHGMCVDVCDPVLSAPINSSDVDPIINYFGASGASSVYGSDLNGSSRVFGYVSTVSQNVSTTNPSQIQNWGTDPSTGKDANMPLLFVGQTAPCWGKGFTTVMYWSLTGATTTPRPTGSTESIVTTNDRIIVNNVSLPWDGSNPTL